MTRVCRAILLLLLATAGCHSPTETDAAKVQFTIDAPLCGASAFQFEFLIDGTVVGTETLRGSQTSQLYRTPPGEHIITARVANGGFNGFVREVKRTLRANETLVDRVSLFCT